MDMSRNQLLLYIVLFFSYHFQTKAQNTIVAKTVKESTEKKETSDNQKESAFSETISENQNLKARYYLETGGVSSQKDLNNEIERLKQLGLQPNFYETLYGYFIIYLASYSTIEEAQKMKASGMNGKYNEHIIITKVTIESKKEIRTKGIQEENIIDIHLSALEDNTIELGYYLVTNLFGRQEYLDKTLEKFKKKGLPLKYFKNPQNGFFYAYIKRFDELKDLEKMFFSNVNGTYNESLFVFKVH